MSFADLESGRPLLNSHSRKGLANGRQDATQSQALAAGIFQISTSVSTFQRLVNAVGTAKDTPELREKLQKARLHIAQLVKDTSAKLKQANELDHHAGISTSKKIADAKLAKDFETILKEFQKAQRLAAEKETAFSPISQTPPAAGAAAPLEGGDASLDKSSDQHIQEESRSQKLVLLDNEIVFNEAIIEEREQGIQDIQRQIGEVNEIFKDLAVLVHDQGTVIDDIQSNIESSYAATSQAKSHLAKASKSQKSNSSMACLLLLIFGIILLIVIIVLIA